jgi:hypothetical protein
VWDGELEIGPPPDPGVHMDIRRSEAASRQLVSARVRWQLSTLVQKIAPNLHRWNRSVLFDIDRLRRDIGWAPEYTFPSMVEHTYEWWRRAGLDRTQQFDFSFEDLLLERVSELRG